MRILITGARGMLGTDACRYFAGIGHEVVGVDLVIADAAGGQDPAGVSFLPLDITDPKSVRGTLASVKPDLVLHCAAYTNVDGCERDPDMAYKINAFGTWSIASATEAVGAALVALSTDFVFGGHKSSPYTEFDQPGPLGHYASSKLAGERLAMRHCSRTYVVRTAWLFGVNGNNFPYAILRRAREKGEVSVVTDQYGTPTFTQDLVRAIDAIVREPLYGIYHASNDGATTWFEYAHAVLTRAGLGSTPVHPITPDEYAVNFNSPTKRPAYSVLRNWSMELRGLPPMRPWQEALDDFVAESKAAGKI